MSWPKSPIGEHTKKIKTWNPVTSGSSDPFDYIDLASVDKEKKQIDLTEVPNIFPVDAPSRARQIVHQEDVIVATVRPNLNGVSKVPESLHSSTASTGYCVLRANDESLDSNYLFYWLQTRKFIQDMMSKATGANYPAVSDRIIKESTIPLPPLAEQKRIAAILDKADAIRRKRQQAIQLADEFLRSVFLDMFGDPVTNPKGWEVKKFEELGQWASGGTPSRSVPEYFEGNIDWYSARELNDRYLNGSIEKITENALRESAAKIFPKGSMLVGMYDTAAFKISILTEPSASNQACANIIPNELVHIEWLFSFIEFSKETYLRQRRGVRQKNLNLGMIKDFELPLPPLPEQEKFLEVVKKLMSTKNYQYETAKMSNCQFGVLSQKAFSG
ncbi:restriction endonuclease subunit S [Neptuniibacter marinus]|uniref:restriction endonuclease subunit S n=1 Tax=Neptuniibacter marinus TaxID=1806670 RepID=UPI003B5C93ED